METPKPKRFKWKWIGKAISWKVISVLLGGGIVHWLTGEVKIAADYLLIYTPVSLLFFVLHELGWQAWKEYRRKKMGITVVEVDMDEE